MAAEAHLATVTSTAPWEPGPPLHYASCDCGWRGRRRRFWDKACDEADQHAAKQGGEKP